MYLTGMSARTKQGLGSAVAAVGVLATVFGPILGVSALPRPWAFLLGFVTGLVLGLGATLTTVGLIEGRSGS